MKNLKQISQFGLLATLIGVTAYVQAADGTPGMSSTGTMQLQVNVPNIIVLSNVADPAPADFDGHTDVIFTDSVCVGSNGATAYSITATSNVNPTSFELSDTGTGGGTTVPYNVAWANSTGAGSGTALTSSVTQDFLSGPVDNIGCTGGTNATVLITVPAASLQLVPAASYTDVLSLTVAPL